MDRESAKQYVKGQEPIFLPLAKKKVNGRNSYICPNCGNGSGTDGDGIALDPHRNGNYYKCFVCGFGGDVIDLWKAHTGVTDNREAFNSLYEYYGIEIDEDHKGEKSSSAQYQKQDKTEHNNSIHTDSYTQPKAKGGDFMDYYRECMERLTETDYISKARGLSDATAKKYMLGYEPHFKTKDAYTEEYVEWKAIIIPTGRDSYIVRNIDPDAQKRNRIRKRGNSKPYLAKSLTEATEPIFIVEGELDALSIVDMGGKAVGLGSTANYEQLLDILKKQAPQEPLVLALDNDEDGQETEEKLAEELDGLDILYYRGKVYGEHKDANEALVADKEQFAEALVNAQKEALKVKEKARQEELEAYLQTSTASHLQDFINGIADSVNTPYISTGFEKLDSNLDGGLYEGLYILGAITSLGKTTLLLQIADQVAEAGEDVLIFSLEMARTELISKSISRLTLQEVLSTGEDTCNAKTARGITTGKRYASYSQEEKTVIEKAITAYGKYAGNIYIHEGIGDIGTEQIRETVEKHISLTGKKPTVIIDYIQILAPYDVRATDKQNTDKAVLELKRISRDYKLPVFGISSLNRENYKREIDMEAFKESGAIEYSSDVLMGLQLMGAGKDGFNAQEAKKKNPREVELVILKNRNGATGARIAMEYYPLFNYFKEV